MSPSKNVCGAAKNSAKSVKYNFPGKYNLTDCSENTFVMGYGAVIKTSRDLDPTDASYFQSIIGKYAMDG